MDPAAIGTTIIGLDRIRREGALDERGVASRERPRRRRGLAVRRRLANTLRRAAERITPAPTPA